MFDMPSIRWRELSKYGKSSTIMAVSDWHSSTPMKQKNDMLVVVDVRNGHVLWNFMHAPSRAMNKHRQGDLLYKRYILEDKEKGSQLAALDI